jgi:ketosteroid isomerase-like protein
MSQENPQQVIQGMYDAYNSDGLKAAGSFLHPQVEYRDDPGWPGGGVHQGRDAVIARFQEVIDALGLQRARLNRVVEAREQTVWVVAYFGQSSGAGVPNDHQWGYVGRIADGQLVDFEAYIDPGSAFEAAGLSE